MRSGDYVCCSVLAVGCFMYDWRFVAAAFVIGFIFNIITDKRR